MSARAAAFDVPKGTVVVARTHPVAVLIWDASPAVGDLVIARTASDAGMRALEADAIGVLAAHAGRLTADRVSVRVTYLPTGVVGAPYQPTTFASATPLMIVTVRRSAVVAQAAAWQAAVAHGAAPPGVTVQITGSFPQSE